MGVCRVSAWCLRGVLWLSEKCLGGVLKISWGCLGGKNGMYIVKGMSGDILGMYGVCVGGLSLCLLGVQGMSA